jgi:phage terminase large subunit
MEYRVKPTEKQLEALRLFKNPDVEVVGFGGAKGGGKSWFLRTRQILRRLQYPNSSGLIVRKTLPELEKNHIRKIMQEWPEAIYDYRDQKHSFKFKNGSILDLGYVDTEEDLERLQGVEYDDIDIDEATQHPKVVFSTLRSCLRTSNAENIAAGLKPTMLLTWNWGGVGHAWIKRMFWRKYMAKNKPDGVDAQEWERIKAADTWENESHWDINPETGYGEQAKQFAFLQAFWYDNSHLDKGYKDRLSALPEQLRKAYMDGDPDIFEGQFFPEFGTHLRERPFGIAVNSANLYGSLDYGEGAGDNAGATSFGLWHIDSKGIPHRLWSYYKKNQNASVYAREIVSGIQSFVWTHGVMPKKIMADPSMFIKRRMDEEHSKSVADVFADHGLTLTPANNDRVNGWRVMREFFARDSITGEPKSRYWEGYNEEYETYIPSLVYSRKNASDVQKGGEDHVGDEARYFFVEAMGHSAKAVKLTPADYAPLAPMKKHLMPLFFSMRKAG